MIKRSFFGLQKPRLEYDIISAAAPEPREISASETVQLFSNTVFDKKDQVVLQPGDEVKTGQKLTILKGSEDYVISPVTGTITSISPCTGDFGVRMTSIIINRKDKEEKDGRFNEISKTPSLQNIKDFLAGLPGVLPSALFSESDRKIDMIVINGMDADLLVNTKQYIVKTSASAIKKGIQILKEITGIENFVIAVPEALSQEASSTGAAVKTVSSIYPKALPHLVLKEILGKEIPAGSSFEELGVLLIGAEAVASLGTAYTTNEIPTKKIITVIDKHGFKKLISTIIGTPLKDIFSALSISAEDSDRIIIGGPMTGSSVYTEDHPICNDTDAVIVQDRNVIPFISDNACINCGECVRICPAKVPANMLVRFLEVSQYEEAADSYDLFSCIECGLCSYVCTAKIPIFQYIRLAKYELARIHAAEAENV